MRRTRPAAPSNSRVSRSQAGGISVADFTGLGVEDLYIAEYVYERSVI